MESRRAILVAGLLIALGGGVAARQSSRHDWEVGNDEDVEGKLIYSLSDAPLTAKERDQIYRLIDDQTVHDSFTDAQRNEERETVMGARVGFITLAEDRGQQLLVRGPNLFCGASGNCPYWVFIRQHGRWRLVLVAGGDLLVRNSASHGFRDLAVELCHSERSEESRQFLLQPTTEILPSFHSRPPSAP